MSMVMSYYHENIRYFLYLFCVYPRICVFGFTFFFYLKLFFYLFKAFCGEAVHTNCSILKSESSLLVANF